MKEEWELEPNIITEDKMWGDMCTGCHKGIRSIHGKNMTES